MQFIFAIWRTISNKFVDVFDRDFVIGNICFLIWINNDDRFRASRFVDSSRNVSSRIDDKSWKRSKIDKNIFNLPKNLPLERAFFVELMFDTCCCCSVWCDVSCGQFRTFSGSYSTGKVNGATCCSLCSYKRIKFTQIVSCFSEKSLLHLKVYLEQAKWSDEYRVDYVEQVLELDCNKHVYLVVL